MKYNYKKHSDTVKKKKTASLPVFVLYLYVFWFWQLLYYPLLSCYFSKFLQDWPYVTLLSAFLVPFLSFSSFSPHLSVWRLILCCVRSINSTSLQVFSLDDLFFVFLKKKKTKKNFDRSQLRLIIFVVGSELVYIIHGGV